MYFWRVRPRSGARRVRLTSNRCQHWVSGDTRCHHLIAEDTLNITRYFHRNQCWSIRSYGLDPRIDPVQRLLCTLTPVVCGFFLSWWGGPPQSFERSIWYRVGFYMIHTFLDPSVESQFRIISKSYNFLFGTTTTQSITFSTSHVFSGQSRHASSSSIMLYLWLGARRPMAQLYDSSSVSRY